MPGAAASLGGWTQSTFLGPICLWSPSLCPPTNISLPYPLLSYSSPPFSTGKWPKITRALRASLEESMVEPDCKRKVAWWQRFWFLLRGSKCPPGPKEMTAQSTICEGTYCSFCYVESKVTVTEFDVPVCSFTVLKFVGDTEQAFRYADPAATATILLYQ